MEYRQYLLTKYTDTPKKMHENLNVYFSVTGTEAAWNYEKKNFTNSCV